jgi:hypothetical protein
MVTAVLRTLVVTAVLAGLTIVAYFQIRADEQSRAMRELQAQNDRVKAKLAVRERMIDRLTRQRRLAHIKVLDQRVAADGGIDESSILFVELDDDGAEIGRRAFTIPGDVLFIDAWTAKFDHEQVAVGHPLRGCTLVLLRRMYSDRMAPADGFAIDTPGAIPAGYAASDMAAFERRVWEHFWEIGENAEMAAAMGVRVAQGEAVYRPIIAGRTYELRVDASGGMNFVPLTTEAPGSVSGR